MTRQQLIDQILQKQSFLCVGLDPDFDRMPQLIKETYDPIFEFNKAIIDATLPYAVAYKPNLAFYECRGESGWRSLQRTFNYLPEEVFTIADAKRGDIGNTAAKYASAMFDRLGANAATVAPYMGIDSVEPFLAVKGKWTILLAATSNAGAADFEFNETNGTPLYMDVITKSKEWGTPDNLMYVVGATRSELLQQIRQEAPDHFLLVPGVGAQGGSLADVCAHGLTDECGLLVNASRSIIYAGDGEDFAEKAAAEAQRVQQEMAEELAKVLTG